MAYQGKSLQQLAAEIERRAEVKRDFITPIEKITVETLNDRPVLMLENKGSVETFDINSIAHEQVAEYSGIPMAYYRRMMEQDPKLLATNVNRWLKEKAGAKDGRRMLRTLDGTARAWLSDSYRPLENEALAEAVLPVLLDMDLMIVSSEITDRRMYIKAVDRSIERDVPTGRKMGDGSHVFFDTVSPALTIGNSETGHGALYVETGVYTKVCTNMAMIGQNMRKYHTGQRAAISDDVYAMLSDQTKRATDHAVWLQVRDMVKAAFDLARFDATIKRLGDATQDAIPAMVVGEVIERVGKKSTLVEGERKGILARLIEGGDLTRYGLSAAITRFSQDSSSYDRATELERLGGDIIELPKRDWEALTA